MMSKVRELLSEIVEHHEPGLMAHDNAQQALALLGTGPALRERCDPYLATIRTALRALRKDEASGAEVARFSLYASLEAGDVEGALRWQAALSDAALLLRSEVIRDAVLKAATSIRGMVIQQMEGKA